MISLETLNIDIFASRMSYRLPEYISWKPDSFSRRVDACLPTIINKVEILCNCPILSYKESFEKISYRHGSNNSNNSSLAKPSLVPKIPSNEHKKSNSNPQNRRSFIEAKVSKNALVISKIMQLVALVVSGKRFL